MGTFALKQQAPPPAIANRAPRTSAVFRHDRSTSSIPRLQRTIGNQRVLQRQRLPAPAQTVPCPTNMLSAAIATAQRWAGEALPILTSLSGKVRAGTLDHLTDREQLARRELLNMFQIDVANVAHAGFLQSVLNRAAAVQNLVSTLTPASFRCLTQQIPECGPAQRAEAFVTGALPIYLCVTAFETQEALQQAHTVLHEVAHLAGALGRETYSAICNPYVLGPIGTQDAMENADHYACLLRVLRRP